ncbi:hypothetical protein U9M48_040570 [Paspalum notatum var. saurae]|uniref:Uncharacterized protein n=1 Tax=Paspalum notatum var. saurae TaxID=547442 RepID=A0AAQ3XEC8_PASNO
MSWPSIPAPPFSFRSSLLLSPTALVQIGVLAPALRSSSLCGSLGSRQLLETVTATRCSCWTKAEDLLLLGILSRQQIVSVRYSILINLGSGFTGGGESEKGTHLSAQPAAPHR